MNRVAFLIDGFNLYHSVVEAKYLYPYYHTKWLDIHSLCNSYLHLIGNDSEIVNISYFSAYAFHLISKDPCKVQRHKTYVEALKLTGVSVHMGKFYKKNITCHYCFKVFEKHEEKKTDVALSSKIFELLIDKICDCIVVVSGDTDFVPALSTAKKLFPNIQFVSLFPFHRKNEELKKVTDKSFTISAKQYNQYQFPDQLNFGNKIIAKPKQW